MIQALEKQDQANLLVSLQDSLEDTLALEYVSEPVEVEGDRFKDFQN